MHPHSARLRPPYRMGSQGEITDRAFSLFLSLSSFAGHGRRVKPPGLMGPPFVMGLSVGREESLSPPDSTSEGILAYETSGFLILQKHVQS